MASHAQPSSTRRIAATAAVAWLAANATPGAPASGEDVQVRVAGLRLVAASSAPGGGEPTAFDRGPGTTLALLVSVPGGGLLAVDADASALKAVRDDAGLDLTSKSRIGALPEMSVDGRAALVEIEIDGLPSASARTLSAEGTLALRTATGIETRKAELRVEAGRAVKLGTLSVRLASVEPAGSEEKLAALELSRAAFLAVERLRLEDAKGRPVGRSAGRGFVGETARLRYLLPASVQGLTLVAEVRQGLKQRSVAFRVKTSLGLR